MTPSRLCLIALLGTSACGASALGPAAGAWDGSVASTPDATGAASPSVDAAPVDAGTPAATKDAGAAVAPVAPLFPASTRWSACGVMGVALSALAHSPDGRLLAIGRDDGRVDVVNVSDGTSALAFALPAGPVNRLTFTDDGQRLAAVGGRTIQIVSLAGTAATIQFSSGFDAVHALQFSPGASLLLAAGGVYGSGEAVTVWRTDGTLVQSFVADDGDFDGGFTDGGASVLLTSINKGATVVPLDGDARRTFELPDDDAQAISSDGAYLARTTSTGVVMFSVKDGQQLWTAQFPDHVEHIPIFLAGGRLMVLTDGGSFLYDVASGALTDTVALELFQLSSGYVFSPAPDGESLAVVLVDGRLQRMSTRDGSFHPAPGDWFGLTFPAATLAASRGGKRLAVSGGSGRAWILDLVDRSVFQAFGAEATFKPELSADGRLLALGGDARSVFRVDDGAIVVNIGPTSGGVAGPYPWPGLSFSPDATVLASGDGGAIELYAIDGRPLRHLPSHAWSAGVAFSPDGVLLATSGPELWRADTATRVWPADVPPAVPDAVRPDDTVQFMPDGKTLLVSNADLATPPNGASAWQATTRLLSVDDGSVVRDFGGSLDRRPSPSPGGDWIVAGSTLVHLATDARLTLDPPPSTSIFLPDGRIAGGATDGRMVRLYCPSAE